MSSRKFLPRSSHRRLRTFPPFTPHLFTIQQPLPSPHRTRWPPNYQDVLVFDSTERSLSHKQSTLEIWPRDQTLSLPTSISHIGGITSISLPGVGPQGRLGVFSDWLLWSALAANRYPYWACWEGQLSGVLESQETWRLEWGTWDSATHVTSTTFIKIKVWVSSYITISYAELSTSSRPHHILPRSIYLSHQFSFRILGEDFHALICQFHPDIGSCKIEGMQRSQSQRILGLVWFVEGFPHQLRVCRSSSSFDEPHYMHV